MKLFRTALNIDTKFEGKLICAFKNDMRSIFTRAFSNILKLGLLLGLFIQNRKCTSLEFTAELCVMTMKNDAKYEEELTCQFKIDMRNLTNSDLST